MDLNGERGMIFNKELTMLYAKMFYKLIQDRNVDVDEEDIIGIALYTNKCETKGIVATKDFRINEDEWTMQICNAYYLMTNEDEDGLLVELRGELK